MMQASKIKSILAEARNRVKSNMTRSQPRQNKTSLQIKITSIGKITPFNVDSKQQTLQTITAARLTKRYSKAKSHASNQMSGMNANFLYMRKENHLNTYFNARKSKLQEITKQNKKIYVRINSQKSLYSSRDLNRSYEQNREIQSRLSQSKLSHRSNLSRSSSRKDMKSSMNRRLYSKKKLKLQIKASNINKAESKELNHFRALFMRDLNKPANPMSEQSKRDTVHNENSKKINKYMRSKVKEIQSIQPFSEVQGDGLLHRIAEQMITNMNKVVPPSKKSHTFRSRKILNF